ALDGVDALADKLASHDYASVGRAEMLLLMDGDWPLALLRLVVAGRSLALLIGPRDRIRRAQHVEARFRIAARFLLSLHVRETVGHRMRVVDGDGPLDARRRAEVVFAHHLVPGGRKLVHPRRNVVADAHVYEIVDALSVERDHAHRTLTPLDNALPVAVAQGDEVARVPPLLRREEALDRLPRIHARPERVQTLASVFEAVEEDGVHRIHAVLFELQPVAGGDVAAAVRADLIAWHLERVEDRKF